MDLKRFLPNKTLVWKDWKNNWLFFALFFGFVIYVTTFTLQNEIMTYLKVREALSEGHYWYGFNSFNNRLFSADAWVGFISVLFTVALAAITVGQERDKETLGLLLAMPYSRRDILFNKVVVGLGQILIILGVNAFLMTMLVWANSGIPFPFSVPDIWGWALHNFLVLTFIFCFTVLIATVSGTTLGNGILALIFLFFPAGLYGLLEININYWISFPLDYARHLYWVWRDPFSEITVLLTVPIWIIDSNILGKYNTVYLYGALAALSAGAYALAQFLFARNPLENNGEVLVFEQLEGIFKLGVVVCFALLGGPLLAALAGAHTHSPGAVALSLCYLLAGGLTWFLTNRLLEWRRAA
jgi:ABC-type transport system involved in multi-copper enzyme maturation permease subunit